jgi:hypothetical protein
MLSNLYTHNQLRVRWNGVDTAYFSAVYGVTQGAILSPVLFCVYVDNLLVALSNAGVGFFIGSTFDGDLEYADAYLIVKKCEIQVTRNWNGYFVKITKFAGVLLPHNVHFWVQVYSSEGRLLLENIRLYFKTYILLIVYCSSLLLISLY